MSKHIIRKIITIITIIIITIIAKTKWTSKTLLTKYNPPLIITNHIFQTLKTILIFIKILIVYINPTITII